MNVLEKVIALTTIVAPILAQAEPQIAYEDLPVEERACYYWEQRFETKGGQYWVRKPKMFCYKQDPVILTTDNGEVEARAYYSTETTTKKDQWSTKKGYDFTVRQFFVIYRTPEREYEARFISSPSSDGIGLYDRDGYEKFYVTETKREENRVIKERNEFTWHHQLFYDEVVPATDNAPEWKKQAVAVKVQKIMNSFRRKGYQAEILFHLKLDIPPVFHQWFAKKFRFIGISRGNWKTDPSEASITQIVLINRKWHNSRNC